MRETAGYNHQGPLGGHDNIKVGTQQKMVSPGELSVRKGKITDGDESTIASLLESAPMGIATIDADLQFTNANAYFSELYGLEPTDFLGRKGGEPDMLLSPEALEVIKKVLETGETVKAREVPVPRRSRRGGGRSFSHDFFPVRAASGRINGVGILAHDMALQAPQTPLTAVPGLPEIVNKLFTFVAFLKPDGELVDVNRPALTIAGLKSKDVVGKKFWEAYWWSFSRESKARLKQAIQEAAAGKRVRYEVKARVKNNKFLYVDFAIVPVTDRHGKVLYLVPSGVDITNHKATADALQLSQKRFDTLVNSSVVGAVIADLKGAIHDANDAFLKMTGYSRAELEAGTIRWDKMTPSEHRTADRAAIDQYLSQGMATPYEKEYIAKDGRRLHVFLAGALINKKSTECIMILLDMTKQKEAEANFNRISKRFEYIASNMIDIITIRDRSGHYIYASPQIEKLTNKTALEIIGKTHWDIGLPEVTCRAYDEHIKTILRTKKPAVMEFEHEKKYYHTILSPEFDARGEVATILAVSRDITAIKEEEHRRDEFISIASHELKTPVTSLKIFTQLLDRTADKNKHADYQQVIVRMNEQIDRLTVLINDLLDVSRIKSDRLKLEMDSQDLRVIIDEAIAVSCLDHPTQRVAVVGKTTRKVHCDKDKIKQVLDNLLSNAIKYSPEQKEIIVRVMPGQDEVTVAVQDFGTGIRKRHQKKIFDLFYRVKEYDRRSFPGLGMGLFISKEIIDRHDGRMWVESIEGEGATFTFTLPYAESKKSGKQVRLRD